MDDSDIFERPPQRRSNSGVWLIAILAGGGALGTCVIAILVSVLIARSPPGQPKVVVATDGGSQVTIPSMWHEIPTLNEKAEIQVGNEVREQYLIVLTEAKMDFAETDLARYADLAAETLEESLTNKVRSPSVPRQVQGRPALEFRITATIDNLNVVYWLTAVEGRDHYYQVLTWTLASRANANESVLRGVADTFTEVRR
jgi:hypothetical protein